MKVIKSTKTISPFAGISFVNESIKTSGIADLIDSTLGKRVKTFGYQKALYPAELPADPDCTPLAAGPGEAQFQK